MRKPTLLLLLSMIVALPLSASRGRDQSYFTFDDGGTIVRQAEDGREVDARVNLPVFPGDEVITNRRGRSEIRLSDGNIIALDRSTSIRFRSILDSYENDAEQTVVELRYGHVAVQRTDFNDEPLRLDTQNGSYVASDQAIYSVDTDSRGADRITVFDGEVEVRTPVRSTSVHQGEEARVDQQGLYGLVSLRDNADEFERWFIRRSERYGGSSRYLDRSLAYSDYDLEQYGSWTYASAYGAWGWRPYVTAGWRPYYYGHWVYGPNGCLVWSSYEPWGWVPYHYGRWAYDGVYGWIWLPGYTYSPAWVYWLYGPGYFGWAPAGWYDCYRPYYGWAYQPYARAGFTLGFGFYGRVRVSEIDLRPWTFVTPDHIISTRVDQAALTTDAIRQRLLRDPNASLATVGSTPARFTRSEIRDPASTINTIARRGIVRDTPGASTTDMTPYLRRDAQLPSTVRDRVVRGGGTVVTPVGGGTGAAPSRLTPSGVPSPGTPGTLEGRIPARGDKEEGGRVDRGNVIDRGNTTGRPSGRRDETPVTPTPSQSTIDRGGSGTTWRDRVERPSTPSTPPERPTIDRGQPPADRNANPPARDDSWRGRVTGRRNVDETPSRDAVPRSAPADRGGSVDRGSDIPRRIIDRIGGARIYNEPSRDTGARERSASPPRESSPPPRESAPRSIERSSPPPREHASSPPPSSSSHSSGGGRVKRD